MGYYADTWRDMIMKVLLFGGTKHVVTIELINQLKRKNIPFVMVTNEKRNNLFCDYPLFIINNRQELIDLLIEQKIDKVIHLWNTDITTNSSKDSFQESEENIERTVDLLEACVEAKVKKLIFPSTISVYGNISEEKITEESLTIPVLFEGLSKKIEEQYIKNYHSMYGLSYSILRFSTLYGNSVIKEDLIKSTIHKILVGNTPILFENGEEKKEFLYITDAVNAIIYSLDKGDNEIINLSGDFKISTKEIVEFIEMYIKKKVSKSLEGEKSNISIEKAKKYLGWEAAFSMEEGIIHIIKNLLHDYKYEEVQ